MSFAVLNGAFSPQSARQSLAGLGKTWVATTPTPGTAVAYANQTSYSATANGFLSIFNGNPVGTATAPGVNIYLDRLKLIQTATAPTGGLVTRFEIFSASAQIVMTTHVVTPVPVNLSQAFANTATGAVIQFWSAGAATVPALTGSRLLHVGSFCSGVNVQQDSWTIEFGADGTDGGIPPLTAARATDPSDLSTWAPAIVVAPQTAIVMNLWGLTPAANVPSYEANLIYNEF